MLISVRVGVFFKMLYPKPKELHAPRPLECAAGTCHPCNISGKKDGVGGQGLPQNAPQASSASLSPSENETTTRKEQSRHSRESRGRVCKQLSHWQPPPLSSRDSARLPLPFPGDPGCFHHEHTAWFPCDASMFTAPTCCPADPEGSPSSRQLILAAGSFPTTRCLYPETVHWPKGCPSSLTLA